MTIQTAETMLHVALAINVIAGMGWFAAIWPTIWRGIINGTVS